MLELVRFTLRSLGSWSSPPMELRFLNTAIILCCNCIGDKLKNDVCIAASCCDIFLNLRAEKYMIWIQFHLLTMQPLYLTPELPCSSQWNISNILVLELNRFFWQASYSLLIDTLGYCEDKKNDLGNVPLQVASLRLFSERDYLMYIDLIILILTHIYLDTAGGLIQLLVVA